MHCISGTRITEAHMIYHCIQLKYIRFTTEAHKCTVSVLLSHVTCVGPQKQVGPDKHLHCMTSEEGLP